jgi:hypothetical protein
VAYADLEIFQRGGGKGVLVFEDFISWERCYILCCLKCLGFDEFQILAFALYIYVLIHMYKYL